MMVWDQKDAPADQLSVKLVSSTSMGIRFIPFEGYEKHWCNTAQLGPDVILVNDFLDFF
jgi:hypothetical protein